MKKQKFNYTTHDGEIVPVMGYIIGDLGVDKQSRFSPEREAKHYNITHLPSGLSFGSISFLLRRDAVEFCKAAQEIWDVSGADAQAIIDRKTGQPAIRKTSDDPAHEYNSASNLRNQIRTLARQHHGDC